MPNKALAEQFARRIELQSNPDIYYDPVKISWDHACAEYLDYKRYVERRADETIRDINKTFTHFRRICGPVPSVKIDQRIVNRFVTARSKQNISPATVNKDTRNLKSFVRWLVRQRYSRVALDWLTQKEVAKPVIALTEKQLRSLLIAAMDYGHQWYILVLLAVTTGLRRRDVEVLTWSSFDFESGTISTSAQKTGKGLWNHPVHPVAIAEIVKYQSVCPEGQARIFTDKWHASKWNKIRCRAGLPGFRFRDLRSSCGSFVAQAGYSTSVVQRILQHSTPALTAKSYIQIDPVVREAVESIPITPVD